MTAESRKYLGAIFFDIDGTWHRWSLFLHLMDALVDYGVLPRVVQLQVAKAKLAWRKREGDYEEYLMTAVRIWEERLAGRRAKDYLSVAEEVVDKRRHEIYRYTHCQIQQRLKQGWFCCAVTASPDFIVEPFCRSWGIDNFLASKQEVDQHGRFTGERCVLHGPEKAKAIQAILSEPQLSHLKRDRIEAYGDTTSDVQMLELAGFPVCVNPSARLTVIAEERGWLCVTERKNVITETRAGGYAKYALSLDGVKTWIRQP